MLLSLKTLLLVALLFSTLLVGKLTNAQDPSESPSESPTETPTEGPTGTEWLECCDLSLCIMCKGFRLLYVITCVLISPNFALLRQHRWTIGVSHWNTISTRRRSAYARWGEKDCWSQWRLWSISIQVIRYSVLDHANRSERSTTLFLSLTFLFP